MNLSDKRDLFVQGNLICDTFIEPETFALHGIKLSSKTSNILFETNVAFESNVLPTKDAVFLGAYSYMNEGGYIRGPVFIGRYCSIGRRVSIGAGMHSITGLSSHPLFSSGSLKSIYSDEQIQALQLKDRRSRGVYIGSDVWIGDGVIILPGVKIGDGSVIGANSVISRDVAPYSIVGGVPSHLLRFRFPEDVCLRLLDSKWWDLKLEKLHDVDHKNIFNFLNRNFIQEDIQSYTTYSIALAN